MDDFAGAKIDSLATDAQLIFGIGWIKSQKPFKSLAPSCLLSIVLSRKLSFNHIGT
jgi:hypothetical protein